MVEGSRALAGFLLVDVVFDFGIFGADVGVAVVTRPDVSVDWT